MVPHFRHSPTYKTYYVTYGMIILNPVPLAGAIEESVMEIPWKIKDVASGNQTRSYTFVDPQDCQLCHHNGVMP